jgi:hypothetical protein
MEDYLRNQLQVVYGRGSKRITLQRAITSKIVHFEKEVTLKDLLVLFDNLLWCQWKSEVDPDFKKKFGLHLKVQAYILIQERVNERDLRGTIKKLRNRFLKNFNHFIFPKRNVKNVLLQQYRFVEVRFPRPQGIDNKKLPPKSFIGKGYRDKGTAKNPAYDGTPSWQEVSNARLWELDYVRKIHKNSS